MPRWFLIINGVALLLLGGGILSVRLREGAFLREMFGILWGLLCCAVGGALLFMAMGYIEQPGTKRPPPPRVRMLEFPTGR